MHNRRPSSAARWRGGREKSGFTLIELLVVIAIIGILSTLAVVALNSARQKSRDSKRVADIKQIQTALELYYAENNGYPTAASGIILGPGNYVALCSNGGFKSTACVAGTDTTYMGLVPAAPTPYDGTCTAGQNAYTYTAAAGAAYTIAFCTGAQVGDLAAGVHTATESGIQ
jgi:prepilin-type N-terminal cleavage/methylation domain-containing protein